MMVWPHTRSMAGRMHHCSELLVSQLSTTSVSLSVRHNWSPCLRLPPLVLVRNCSSSTKDTNRIDKQQSDEFDTVHNAVSTNFVKLEKIQREVKGLRADLRRLTAMLEQDFAGDGVRGRKSIAGAAPLTEVDQVSASRSSLQGAPSLVETTTTEPGPETDEVFRRVEIRPSVKTARLQPTHISEIGHSTLAHLALQGNHFAHRERMIREIMSVDNVNWEEAHETLEKMDLYKERNYWWVTMPYRIGICVATACGVASIAMVFHPRVAFWYGTEIAGEDLPYTDKDVNDMTINQVGTWTWSWMEPMIGTASFVLLCAQFMRGQLIKLQMKTFLEIMESRKANKLATQFMKYDKSMVRTWAKPLPRANISFFPIYERTTGIRGPSSGL